MRTKISWLVLCTLGARLTAVAAAAAETDKSAFLAREKMYLSFEVTLTGERKFGAGTPADAIVDGAYRRHRTVRGEVPLDMPVPGSFPMSSMPLGTMEMLEQDRFIGWMAAPPDDPGTTADLSKNPMFLPVEFSIDDEEGRRYRDFPSQPWGTETRTLKGHGIAYVSRGGLVACDLKKMTCDINGVFLGYHQGTDLVTVTSASDVPGFQGKRETVSPEQLLPKVPEALAKRLLGFKISLPEPITATFSEPASDGAEQGTGTTSDSQPIVTVQVTLSPHPAPRAAPLR